MALPDLKARTQGSQSRIEKNQEERYHALPIGTDAPLNQALFIDFKKVFGLRTSSLYAAIGIDGVRRIAMLPPVYLHDLVHRFFSFQSRVALP